MIDIVVETKGEPPETHEFSDRETIRVGRDEANDVVLSAPGASRFHAEIRREGDTYTIFDLGSTNGMLAGQEKVSELTLSHGSSVVLGQSRLTFALPTAPGAARTMQMSYEELVKELDLQGPPSEEPASEAPALPPPSAAAPPPPAPAPADDRERESAPSPSLLYLIVGFGSDERSLKLAPGVEYVIGRATSADVPVDDDQASRHHAKVVSGDGRYRLVDLESANGTVLNGERISDAVLSPGDRILIGRTEIHVEDHIAHIADQDHLLGETRMGIPLIGADAGQTPDAEIDPPARLGRLGLAAGVVGAIVILGAGVYLGIQHLRSSPTEASAPGGVGPAAPSDAPNERAIVQLAAASVDELVFAVEATGTIEPARSAIVSAEVAARVADVLVDRGDRIDEGELIAVLNDRDIRNQLSEARASLSSAQVQLAREDYDRKQRLFDQGAIVRSQLDQAQAHYLSLDSAFRSTQAQIAQLTEQLSKTRITSPFSGRVADTMVNAGEFVGPGTPVAALENTSEVLVEVTLSDRDIVRAEVGQPVEARTDAFPEEVFPGEVARVGGAINPVTRAFVLEARLSNPENRLRSGMIVSLRIVEGVERGLVVPAEAVVESPEGTHVFRVEDGVVRQVAVRLGRRLDRRVQVLEGLEEGDRVVVYGHARLRDGQTIQL